jgi:Uri superfamily endonuclease
MDKGTYCLVFKTPGCTIRVGALGDLLFQAGWYMYVGSALGSGGLKRLKRHISLARLRDKQPAWHVDYLLTSPEFSLKFAVCAISGDRFECQLSRELNGTRIPGFGCSDCSCTSHLFYRKDDPLDEILTAFRSLRLSPLIKTIINAQGIA